MKTIEIESTPQMIELGRFLGERVQPGDLLFLSGELGAGKTTLTKGIARGLQIDEEITSPTFPLKKTYCGIFLLNHLDLYRLKSPAELDILEPEEMLEEGVTVVEWGELLRDRVTGDYLEIQISFAGNGTKRIVEFTPHGAKYRQWIEAIANVNIGN